MGGGGRDWAAKEWIKAQETIVLMAAFRGKKGICTCCVKEKQRITWSPNF